MSKFIRRTRCPACGATGCKIRYSAPLDSGPVADYLVKRYSGRVELSALAGGQYVIAQCLSCFTFYQKEILGKYLTKLLYDEWILPSIEKTRDESIITRAYTSQDILQLIAYLKRKPGELKTCDFGMGWGHWALMSKALGCRSLGTELSEARLAEAKRNGIDVLSWDEIPGSEFDIINADQVLEHVDEPIKILGHLKAGLRRNGIIKFSVPHVANIERRVARLDWDAAYDGPKSIMPLAPLEHINFYNSEAIKQITKRTAMKRVFVPMLIQYQYTTAWASARQVVKNLGLPFYRNVYRTPRYVVLSALST